MTITLYNTATRRKEAFAPLDPNNVRMYLCGPTVYDRAHLGNARPVLVFDVLYRLLRHTYGAEHVTYVRNFTDVDDKINATALARKEAGAAGTIEELVRARSDETISWYHADMDALGAMRPDHEPRATEYIAQMVEMISGLIADGYAYENDGHVLFRVRKYAEYGALSGRSVDDMIAGARVEVAPYKEDPMDFVLWKPSDEVLPGWESPWGRGRPGWHIECSAMAYALLGAEFDIHGGGNDLQFPHHENEIAQSRCAGHDFARVWMHNEMLQVEGKKMSKSLGNFFTVRDLLDQGVPGEVIRFVMLSTHYRKPMDWTEKKRAEAEKTLRKWAAFLADRNVWSHNGYVGGKFVPPPAEFLAAMSDDLNTSLALKLMRDFASNLKKGALISSLILLGFDPKGLVRTFHKFHFHAVEDDRGSSSGYKSWGDDGHEAAKLIHQLGIAFDELRKTAKQTKDFSAVDQMKAQLLEAGVEVRMSKEGVELLPSPEFDRSKLEGLL
ncbi:cysteine--tRNA ligase [uncultured Tateyamaria sp.]|uniref:cysteine--tRNA ligase n=1 Tax=uncultured Tateyamaria sp. TaxID=455651 RepID=UPI002626861C|nr:cysteine--tRNA ligase [uncultured Tateyamaria sp.]